LFRLSRMTEAETLALLAAAHLAPVSSPDLLTAANGLLGTPPRGFVHDISQSELGRGRLAFEAARDALLQWRPFDLGWVRVVNPGAKIAPGQLIGVQAHTAYLWSVNLSRVVQLLDSPTRFGFLYATTALHVEQGQERFVIDFDPSTESVSYLIEAVSRPRHPLARLGYPFSRAMQHRFARDSHARMREAVLHH
jgi:uncharacterized protein (UPF0548 family)